MEPWYKRAALALLLLLCLFLGWCAFRPTTLTVHNQSDSRLDSMVIYVQNIRKVLRNVTPHSTYVWYVPTHMLQHNGHDAMVSVRAYLPNGSSRYGYWYTDLIAPSVPRNTVITLHEDTTVSVLDQDMSGY